MKHLLKTPATRRADLEHERLTSLINSMADAVIATDEKAHIVMYNGAALNILDLNSSMHGKAISSVMKLVDSKNQPINIAEMVLKTKTPTSSRDLLISYPDKSTINLYLSIAPVRLGYGKAGKGFVLLMRDITREKSLEEERDEFISVISHELRTPIAIAEGNISNAEYIYGRGGDRSEVGEALKVAHEQTKFLGALIGDLSTLARAERGKLAVEIEPINAHELIDELVSEYLPQTAIKKLELKSDIDPHLEVLMSGRLYVREVLQNFITNAVKYTETGSVTIGARAKPEGVEFFVHDTGIGISKPDQEKVFEKFFRSEDYRTRKNTGTGLGLYVTMKLARLLHAEIKLESELNVGSTFTIYIPNLKKETAK